MRIPNEFVRRFENGLSSEATIGVPDGLAWKMELEKSENEVCFCKGWQEFVKYYSISFGFFLVFKYEGNSQFSVVIFDVSGAEITIHAKLTLRSRTRHLNAIGKGHPALITVATTQGARNISWKIKKK
ncbi:B3 domain-containing transcription factor VRN1-like [Prosopis cineraria]|uniref:B3 domain-containing transcription factor VRN1-like n=1 Tax=Prosopis cineraria TaxID=364024 RepID=UPI00240F346A|nr:B3 domain-containing transcription factor VRN1-like [Prosopis cineraria]